jgi:putative transposase
MTSQWPHAPLHLLETQGVYMVTASTYLKAHHFKQEQDLTFLHDTLQDFAKEFDWELHAWAIFSNHYHFIGRSSKDPSNLRVWLSKFHYSTASKVNKRDGALNRRVWYQFWDTKITKQTSYLARLKYVHQNPVKHGLVSLASQYRWCSAASFERNAKKSFVDSVNRFDVSNVNVFDDF